MGCVLCSGLDTKDTTDYLEIINLFESMEPLMLNVLMIF